MLSNSIEDDKKKPKKLKIVATTTPKPTPDDDQPTSTAAYRLRKDELQRLVLRNLRGIIRLYNQELAIATKVNILPIFYT